MLRNEISLDYFEYQELSGPDILASFLVYAVTDDSLLCRSPLPCTFRKHYTGVNTWPLLQALLESSYELHGSIDIYHTRGGSPQAQTTHL